MSVLAKLPMPTASTHGRRTTITDDPPVPSKGTPATAMLLSGHQRCDAVRRSLILTSNRVLRSQPFLIRIVSTLKTGSRWT